MKLLDGFAGLEDAPVCVHGAGPLGLGEVVQAGAVAIGQGAQAGAVAIGRGAQAGLGPVGLWLVAVVVGGAVAFAFAAIGNRSP